MTIDNENIKSLIIFLQEKITMHIKPTGRIPNNLDSDILYFAKKNMTVSMEMNLSVLSFMLFFI